MTLGLATCSDDGIYLAIESEGLPAAGPSLTHKSHLLIDSKILELQSNPQVIVLAAGGLEHWSYVAANYSSKSSVTSAAAEIVRLLNLCMSTKNRAYGLVCGYESGDPKCYRITRHANTQAAEAPKEVSLTQVQCIGAERHAKAAKDCAANAIGNQVQPLLALVEAIQRRFPGEDIRRPIHVFVMRDDVAQHVGRGGRPA